MKSMEKSGLLESSSMTQMKHQQKQQQQVVGVGMGAGVRIRWWWVMIVTWFAIGLYWRELDGAWILDDKGTITMNPVVKGETDWMEVWNRDFWGRDALKDAKSHKSWRPLCTATYRLNYQFFQYSKNKNNKSQQKPLKQEDIESYWFHVVDRVLHGLVTGLSYMVSCYGWMNLVPGPSGGGVLGEVGPMVVSLLFAAHPIHVESVANSTGRAEVLCAFFYFLGFISYAQCTTRRHTAVVLPCWSVLLCTLASMLCKEHGITLPILCLIWDAYLHTQTSLTELVLSLPFSSQQTQTTSYHHDDDNKEKDDIKEREERRRRAITGFWFRVVLLGMGSIGLALWRWNKNDNIKPDFVCEQNPAACETQFWTRWIHYSYLWCFNFYLLLFPEWLSPDWSGDSLPLLHSPYVTDPRFPACLLLWYTLMLFLYHIISTALVFCPKSLWKRSLLTSICWMLLPFLLSSNLLVYVGFVVADRTLYLPSFGYCLLFIQILDAVYLPCYHYLFPNNTTPSTTTQTSSNHQLSKRKMAPLVMMLGLIMGGYVWKQQIQTKNWSDPVLIWGEGYRVNPNSCINGKEYASSLVNVERNKDAADLFLLAHRREQQVNWFSRHISDTRPKLYPQNQNLTQLELKIKKWSRLPNQLQSQFKLVTAMGNSGSCVEARTYIEQALTWANDALALIEEEKTKPGADMVGTQLSSRTYSLPQIEQAIKQSRALLLVARSRCAKTLAIMGQSAYDAILSAPGDQYVANHAQTINNLMGQVLSQQNSNNPHEIYLSWTMNANGQTASLNLQAKNLQIRI